MHLGVSGAVYVYAEANRRRIVQMWYVNGEVDSKDVVGAVACYPLLLVFHNVVLTPRGGLAVTQEPDVGKGCLLHVSVLRANSRDIEFYRKKMGNIGFSRV